MVSTYKTYVCDEIEVRLHDSKLAAICDSSDSLLLYKRDLPKLHEVLSKIIEDGALDDADQG